MNGALKFTCYFSGRCVFRLAWAAAAGDLALHGAPAEQLREAIISGGSSSSTNISSSGSSSNAGCNAASSAGAATAPPPLSLELTSVAKEAMEVLTLTIALHPEALDQLVKDKTWQSFVIDLVLLCK